MYFAFSDFVQNTVGKLGPIVLAKGPVPTVRKKNSCLTQLSMKFFLLINVKMPTIVGILTFIIVGILTFMSRKNRIIVLSESEKKNDFFIYFYT